MFQHLSFYTPILTHRRINNSQNAVAVCMESTVRILRAARIRGIRGMVRTLGVLCLVPVSAGPGVLLGAALTRATACVETVLQDLAFAGHGLIVYPITQRFHP